MGDVILNGLCMFVKMYTYKNVYGVWFVFWIMPQLMHLQIEYTIADTIPLKISLEYTSILVKKK